MSTFSEYDQIDQYLKGVLSAAERDVFEQRMQQNPVLAEEVQLQSLLRELVLEKALADIHAKVGEDLSQKPSGFSLKTIGLCLLAVVFLAGTIFYFVSDKQTGEKVIQPVSFVTLPSGPIHSELNKTSAAEQRKPSSDVRTSDAGVSSNAGSKGSGNTLSFISAEQQQKHYPFQQQEYPLQKQADTLEVPKIVSEYKQGSDVQECPDILFEVESLPSCSNKANGTVQVLLSSIKGGRKPYTYSIAGSVFGTQSLNSHLTGGSYSVSVKDAGGCISAKQVQVAEKSCIEHKDYSFNPETESWIFAFNNRQGGTVTVMDKNGKLVYKTTIAQGQSLEWGGRTLNGELLETDTYVYIAESETGEQTQGYIVILH